jgi:hypothetical protein
MASMPRPILLVCLLVATLGSAAPAAVAASGKPGRPASRARAESALLRAEKLLAGQGVRSGREVTLALAGLARRLDALPTSDRKRARGLLARPTQGNADPEGHGYSVGEHAPYCATAHFCIHFVTTTADAPALTDSDSDGFPNYVENMATEFEFVYSVENGSEAAGGLGWTAPESDGSLGGNSKTDVYIAQIGDEGIFGYAAPEQNSVSSYAYLVMDDDYSEFGFANPLDALRVTAAHEYNHVLQFTYDSIQDLWMLEATAVWAEEQVYPAVNDYLTYVNEWAGCTAVPLTDAPPPGATCDLKVYGDAVWNHWLGSRYGRDEIRRAWELSDVTTPEPHLAPDAYDESLLAGEGATFGDEFGRFAAAVAEWRAPASPFPDHASYPDVSRTGTPLTVNGGLRTVTLDHTTFALIDVTPDATRAAIELSANAPAGSDSTLALVGRTGADPAAGTVTTAAKRLPSGGTGRVALANPGSFGRITAVLVNADFSQAGFDGIDWIWSRDGQAFQNVQVVAPAPPVVPAARLKLTSRLSLRSPQRLLTALRRGVLARVRCNQACRVRMELRLDRRTAHRLHLRRVVGRRVVILKRAGAGSVRVRIGRRARVKLRRRKRVRLTVRVRASHGSARAALLSRRVTLKR